jgi:hypothetical protein
MSEQPVAPDPMEARAAAGRALVERYASSIVKVELVATLKMSIGGRSAPPRERKLEANGTVISPTGLTVTSLSQIDPGAAFEAIRASMGAAAARVQLDETEYKEVKLGLSDGTTVPAKVVLKDTDLDLAFVAPDVGDAAAKRQFDYVKLDDAAVGEVLGNYYSISRASKALQQVPLVSFSTVSGIVQKPRQMFIVVGESPGSPVFDAKGHVLGICVRRSGGSIGTFVILPAADVADEAKQAAAAKPENAADTTTTTPEKSDPPAVSKEAP